MSPTPTPWCDTHDLPTRSIRTADDRIVCWYIWWLEEAGARFVQTETNRWVDGQEVGHCRLGTRIVT